MDASLYSIHILKKCYHNKPGLKMWKHFYIAMFPHNIAMFPHDDDVLSGRNIDRIRVILIQCLLLAEISIYLISSHVPRVQW